MKPTPWRARLCLLGAAGVLAGLGPPAGADMAPTGPALTVRFAPERDYGPFVFVGDDGLVQGLSVELLERLAPLAGLRLEHLPAAPLADQLALLRRGKADLVSSVRPTPERAAFLAFSRPYVQVPAIVVKPAHPHPDARDGMAALAALAGRPVAVGAGYAVEAFVRDAYPAVRWVAVSDDVQALRGVVEGRFDAAVVDAASAAFVSRRHGIRGLASAGPIGFEYTLSFAAPLARTDLIDRLDRAIHSLPLDERTAILQRWMGPLDGDALMAQPRLPTWLGLALLALGALLAAGGLWRWRSRARQAGSPP